MRREPPGGWAAHEGLIAQVAGRYWRAYGGRRRAPGAVEFEDCMQAGRMGMLRAAETWDPARGAWSTYALPWIRHAVGRWCQDNARNVRIPVHLQERLRKAGKLKSPRAERRSLDTPVFGGDDEARTLGEMLPANDNATPEDAALEADLQARLDAALATLPPRTRDILQARLSGEWQLAELGKVYGLSRERVRQLQVEAIAHVRERVLGPRRRERAA